MSLSLKRLILRLLILPPVVRAISPFLIARYLRSHASKRLHLGGGGLTGWLNTDLWPSHWRIARLDATRPFPLPTASFDFVFSEHMIEHVTVDGARRMLAESHRVLRPGGWIRIATPDLARIVRIFSEPADPAHQRYNARSVASFHLVADLPARTTTFNSLFYLHGHRFIYDHEALATLFRQAGFVDIRPTVPGESAIPELRDVHQHHYAIGVEANLIETLVLEGRRP